MSAHDRLREKAPLWLWCRLRGGDDARRRCSPGIPGVRRFHAYGVGIGKTGTTSLSAVFEERHRAAHSPGAVFLAAALERSGRGRISRRGLIRFFRHRDAMLRLEMESNLMLGPFVDVLAEVFPRARFVLTTRDCFTWLEAMIAQALHHRSRCSGECPWHNYGQWAWGYGSPLEYTPEESALRELRLAPLSSYFRRWSEHNEKVLGSVPPDRLLVVPTFEITARLPEIARFVGADESSLDAARAHSHGRTEKPVSVLDMLGAEFLNRQAERWCGDLMRRLFPDIRSADDAFAQAHGLRPAGAGDTI